MNLNGVRAVFPLTIRLFYAPTDKLVINCNVAVTMATCSEITIKKAVWQAESEIGFALKPKQIEAVVGFCGGNDIFVSLPTGYGKSIIFGILPRVFDLLRGGNIKYILYFTLFLGKWKSILLCICPLTAIMIDQKEKFISLGLSVEYLGEANTASHRAINGDVQIVLISPENLLCNTKYRQMLLSPVYKERLIGVAVDEVHCVKTW